jgi:hypothetical protein
VKLTACFPTTGRKNPSKAAISQIWARLGGYLQQESFRENSSIIENEKPFMLTNGTGKSGVIEKYFTEGAF